MFYWTVVGRSKLTTATVDGRAWLALYHTERSALCIARHVTRETARRAGPAIPVIGTTNYPIGPQWTMSDPPASSVLETPTRVITAVTDY